MNGYEYEYEYVVLRLNGVVWSGELGFIPVRRPSLFHDSKETCDDPTGRNRSIRDRRDFGHLRDAKTCVEDWSISRIFKNF